MTSGLRGLVNASYELVSRLRDAGHSVTYACPHPIGDYVRAQGIAYVQLSPVNFSPAPEPQRVTGMSGGIRSRQVEWSSARRRRRKGVEELGMETFCDFL